VFVIYRTRLRLKYIKLKFGKNKCHLGKSPTRWDTVISLWLKTHPCHSVQALEIALFSIRSVQTH